MSEQPDLVNITVQIAGRPYPLKVKANDEDAIRVIVHEINEKISRFQLTYSTKDKQDCLSMALLTYAVDLHKAGQNQDATETSQLYDKVDQLDQLLDHLLQ